MTTTCASCRAEVGDAAFCPQCGRAVLSPQSLDQSRDQSARQRRDRSTDTAERPVRHRPVEPAPAASTPGPARFPLYADQIGVSGHGGQQVGRPPPPSAYLEEVDDEEDLRGGAADWLPWAIVALVMVLVAVGGLWLLLSPSEDDPAADSPAPSQSAPEDPVTDSATDSATDSGTDAATESAPPPSEPVPAGDAVDVAPTATAAAPRTAPPNTDVFGNRTTYVAANMLDGRPDTCWRMAGDGTGAELRFQLAAPIELTRVGLINGYAKNALVGGRNLNWYVGNRRVLSAQWVFDDGTTVDQPLVATKQLQTVDLGEPVTTSAVTLRLLAVSSPGTGRSARDYTAVSEVALVGIPTA